MSENGKDDFAQMIEDLQKQIDAEEQAIYSRKVIQEYQDPKNVGRMTEPDAFGMKRGSCGDTMEIYLRISDGKVTEALFMTDGCGPTIACGSLLARMIKGKHISVIERIRDRDLIDALDGLPDENLHCAELAVGTLIIAIRNYQTSDAKRK